MIGYTTEFLDLEKTWAEPSIHSAEPLHLETESLSGLNGKLSELQSILSAFRKEVQKHIIEKEEVNPFDFIQHRAGLLFLLGRLDQLFLAAAQLPRSTEVERQDFLAFMTKLDELQAPLYRELMEWHGKPEDQPDIPADLIAAFRDVAADRTVDMETALHASPEV